MVARNRIVLEGLLGSEGEVWSTGVTFAGATGSPVIADQSALNEWAQAVADLLDTAQLDAPLSTSLSISGTINRVVAQYYNASNDLTLQGEAFPVDYNGGATLSEPLQTSVCLSLTTGVPGSSYRGRNYWPTLALGLSPNGRISGAFANNNFATAWADWLVAVGNAAPVVADMQAHVYSPTRDILTPVSGVRVGDVPDTQRRRRDALIENYSAIAYTP